MNDESHPSQLSTRTYWGGSRLVMSETLLLKQKKTGNGQRQIIHIVHNIIHIPRIPTRPKVLLAARLVFHKTYRHFRKKINNYASATDCL